MLEWTFLHSFYNNWACRSLSGRSLGAPASRLMRFATARTVGAKDRIVSPLPGLFSPFPGSGGSLSLTPGYWSCALCMLSARWLITRNKSSSSLSLCFFLFVNDCGNVENSKPWPRFTWLFLQKETGGRKRTPFELRARPGGRSSAREPGSSRTGPRLLRADRRKGERPGCGITHGGLP